MPLSEVLPSADFRDALARRGGETAARCYQCATCSSICQLAPAAAPFPRRQMLNAQWGLGDRLAADPAVWLCHQCNDCTTRCPRDAKPGDVMQTVRSLVVEQLAAPAFMGRLVARAAYTWPILLGLPLLFWIAALYSVNGLVIPASPLVYENFIPHWLIYAVFFPVSGLVLIAAWTSGSRFWRLLGQGSPRSGSFLLQLVPAFVDISRHNRFGDCDTARGRRWGHFALLWGFVGAAVTSGFIVFAIYILKEQLPLGLWHPFKIMGNISAVLLVAGGAIIAWNRWFGGGKAGKSTAFDHFFLAIVVLVIVTGVLAETGRLLLGPALACALYIGHLTAVLCLFATFPYSKFAHLMYRTLAMVHARMAGQEMDVRPLSVR